MKDLKRLGMDEIALRKGHKDYVVVFVDLESRTLLDMAPSRKHVEIQKVLDRWGDGVLSQIEEVSIDLNGNYRGIVLKNMPDASIVADRFHVMKLVSTELNSARIAFSRKNEQNPNAEEKERIKAALVNSKYALLKPEENLSENQKIKLAEVKAISPLLSQMHQQKEEFRTIFETATSWTEGTLQLLDWLAEAQKTFKDSVGTIGRWFGEVLSYFDHRTTSGVVEGINNKLKLIKRSGYGFRNFENFRLRCLICWHL
jgi:transposase